MFCAETGVPRATFNLWQREARDAPAFARVELGPPSAPRGLTLVVRRPGGLEAEVTGLDAATVVAVMQPMLRGVGRAAAR
jgi:hypothetical protein